MSCHQGTLLHRGVPHLAGQRPELLLVQQPAVATAVAHPGRHPRIGLLLAGLLVRDDRNHPELQEHTPPSPQYPVSPEWQDHLELQDAARIVGPAGGSCYLGRRGCQRPAALGMGHLDREALCAASASEGLRHHSPHANMD